MKFHFSFLILSFIQTLANLNFFFLPLLYSKSSLSPLPERSTSLEPSDPSSPRTTSRLLRPPSTSPTSTPSLTTSTMPSLSVQVVLVSALPLVSPMLASTLLVSQSFSPPVPTLSLPKVVSMQPSVTCTRTTGTGTCTIPSRVPIGSVTKMPSTT